MSDGIKASACPLDCPDLCSLQITVAGGKVTKLTGTELSPITSGVICAKVRKFADHLYCPERVLTPLIRTGAKGSGEFRTASWDEALTLIVTRLQATVATHGAEAILPCHYGGSNGWLTEGALATRFFRRLGASRLERTLCATATTAASRGLFGKMPGVALEDLEHARLIVLWGANPSAAGIHLVPVIDRALAAGAKLIVVDPRRTPLAKRAHLHVALRPGTDLPVALALGQALLATPPSEFTQTHVAHVAEYAKRAAPWTLAKAAQEAGIDEAVLHEFLTLYQAADPAVIRVGWGLERNRNGGSAVAAILALPALAGKFGTRGAGFTLANSEVPWTVSAEAGIATPEAPTRVVNQSGLAHALATLSAPPITTLFVYNNNPVATVPNQHALIAQLQRDDLFVIVHEQVMTDTAQLADVVLPATTFVEHRELRRGYGIMRMFDSPPVVKPAGEARSNNWLFGELLTRLNLVQPGDPMSDQAIVDAIFAASPHGAALQQQLATTGVACPPIGPRPIPFVDLGPTTPSGKVELVPAALDAEAPFGLYYYQADPASEAFPLALISPALATQISSTFGQLRTKPAELVMHPSEARARDLHAGQRVRVWNELGEVICDLSISDEVRPGVVSLAKGLWRKHTRNGYTSNALIPERFADLGGQAAFNDARVQVEAASV